MKIVFCFLFASFFQTQIHKHSRSLLYNCWRRIEEGFSSFFFFLQEKLEKRWNSVGFSSVNIVDFFCGFHRDVLLLLKLYTLVEEPSLDQISQALQATVFCNWKKKNQTHLSSFHFSEKWNKLVWQSTAKRGENWNEFVLNKLNLHPIG